MDDLRQQQKRKPFSVVLLMIGSLFNAFAFLRMIVLYNNYLFVLLSIAFVSNFILWFKAHKASKLFTIILLWITAVVNILIQSDELSRMYMLLFALAVPLIWTIFLINSKKVDSYLGIVRHDKKNND